MFKHGLSKYRAIVAAVALFLVVDLGVLVMNFYIASQIKNDASSVNLAGRQRMLSQRMAKTLYQLQANLQAGLPVTAQMTELKLTFDLFDHTLNAFLQGGTVKGGSGEDLSLTRIETDQGQKILQQASGVWAPYRTLVQASLTDASTANIDAAVAAGAANNLKLLKLMNDLTTHVEQTAAGKAQRLRIVQAIGMVLAILNFILILFHFVKRLREGDQALEAAKQETDQILDTVNEGLFLLDKNLRIGTQYAKYLEQLFRRDRLANCDFVSLLSQHVSERNLQLVKDYVGLLLERRVNANLIEDLNPLNRVEMNFQDGGGGLVTKYLDFRFRRVIEHEQLAHILVTVSDTTEQVQLQQSLNVANERAEQQIKMVSELLSLDPQNLTETLRRTREGFVQVNDILREPPRHGDTLVDKLNNIFRIVHRVKGDAGTVGLTLIERHAHLIEDSLAQLNHRTELTGNDFLAATVHIEKLLGLLDNVEEMLTRLGEIRGTSAPAAEDLSLSRRLSNLAERGALRQGKAVALVARGLDDTGLPATYRNDVQEMAQQFVRNAVAHGIEDPALRRSLGKPPSGLISVAWTERSEGGYALSVEDDGGGIALGRVRARLIETGMPADAVAAMPDARVLEQLFAPGFSTRSEADEDAGRGVGLDGVRAIAQRYGGRIRLHSRPGEVTRFQVLLPALGQSAERLSA